MCISENKGLSVCVCVCVCVCVRQSQRGSDRKSEKK